MINAVENALSPTSPTSPTSGALIGGVVGGLVGAGSAGSVEQPYMNMRLQHLRDIATMSRTKIELIKGPDPASPIPSFVKAAGLIRRIAVIQHTHRADLVDMYFDEPLWLRLLEFAMEFGRDHEVRIIDPGGAVDRGWLRRAARDSGRSDEVHPDAFLSEWNTSKDRYRDPPEYIVVRQTETLVLCIVTEYWTQIGGPAPYADSYTYSIFSKIDVARPVEEYLKEAESVDGWELSTLELPFR
jgi:hypothetical protein